MAVREVGNLRTRLSWEDEGSARSLEGFKRDLRGLRSEMNLARSRGVEYTRSLKGLREQSDILTRRFKTQEERVQELRRRYEESAKVKGEDAQATQNLAAQYNDAVAQMNRTEEQLKRVNSAIDEQINPWKRLGTQMDETGEKMQNIGRSMTDFGKNYTTRITAPIIAGGAAVFKASMDFESAFAGVLKTVDGTPEQLANIRQEIRDMAKDIPATTTEIAGVAEAAGQLGIQTENITEFTRTMIDLGEATNLTSEQAATEFARFANIVGMSQSDFDKLGSTIVALGNNLATTEAEISSMAMRLAGAGSQIGLTEAEIVSFAAALSSVGIEAEAGGSAFSKVMVEMQLAAETGGDELENFAKVAGMSASDFKKAFEEDATGAIIAFIQGLSTAEERGLSAIGILDEMGIKEVRLRDTLLRASGASDVFTESIELGTKAWEENTALTEEAEQRYATTESQLRIMWNRVKDVAITLGDALAPAIMDAIDAAEPFIRKIEEGAEAFSEMDEEQQRNILKLIGLVAAVGPASMALGGLTTTIGGLMRMGGRLSTTIGTARGAGLLGRIGLLGPAASTPVGLAIAGVGALGFGIYALSQAKEHLHDVNYDVIDEFEREVTAIDELIAEYEELESQNKLTEDQMLRYMDILKELENTTSEEKVTKLKEEQAKLEEQSGLTGDELRRFLDLNGEIIEKAPATEQAISVEGDAYAKNLDALKDLNEEKREQMKIEAGNELRKALENQVVLLEKQKELIGDIKEAKSDMKDDYQALVEISQTYNEEEAKLRDIQSEINDLQKDKNSATEEESALIDIKLQQLYDEETAQLGILSNHQKEKESIEATYESQLKKIEAKEEDLRKTEEELSKIELMQGQYEDLILAQVGLTAERGKGIEKLDQEIGKLESAKELARDNLLSGELTTEEYDKQVLQLDNQLDKFRDAKQSLRDINTLAGSEVYADQNKQLDIQLDKFGDLIITAEDLHEQLAKGVNKEVDIETNPSISNLNEDLSKPIWRTINLRQKLENSARQLFGSNADNNADGTNYFDHPSGMSWLGEEGPELVRHGSKWALADFGLYSLPRGSQVFTNDETKKILQSLNNIPAYATGISPPGEANRIVNQLNQPMSDSNGQVVALLRDIARGIREGKVVHVSSREVTDEVNHMNAFDNAGRVF